MEKNLILDILEELTRHGYIGPLAYRNEQIRHEYCEMRKFGARGKEACEQIAERHNIDHKTVETIIYSKKKGK
jgi:ribosomal protein S8